MARGYFGIGIEGVSKPMNLGNLIRSAHAFGAGFVFSVDEARAIAKLPADTSRFGDQVPYHRFASVEAMILPERCQLVGVELTDEAVDLPSFRHPTRAAYVLGPERGALSPAMLERCDFTVKIPTRFCINVAVAGAIVMYDRMRTSGGFAERPVRPGGPLEADKQHSHGVPKSRELRQKLARRGG